MKKRTLILQNAMFRNAGGFRGEDAAVSASQIAEHTGFTIFYVCKTLQDGVNDGHVKRIGTRTKYRYCAAA